jgi:hypothetical protein
MTSNKWHGSSLCQMLRGRRPYHHGNLGGIAQRASTRANSLYGTLMPIRVNIRGDGLMLPGLAVFIDESIPGVTARARRAYCQARSTIRVIAKHAFLH